jgi:hypothetical protein
MPVLATSTASSRSSAFRWPLTSGAIARTLVSTADLAIDDAKEATWMALYAHDRVILEDTLCRCLQDLWSDFTDAITIFDANGGPATVCAKWTATE